MEDESGLDSPSVPNDKNAKMLTFSEWADELCPHYMAIGVPYKEYWYGDYTQLQYYVDAYQKKQEHENYNAWLQGAYMYDALCMVSPVLHAFARKGTKPTPYHTAPYGANYSLSNKGTDEDKPQKTEKEIQEIQALNASAKFASFMTQWNKRYENKGGEANGNND